MKLLLIITLIILNSSAFSFGGDRTQNGGDSCEKRIQPLQDELIDWLTRYDQDTLELPDGVKHKAYQREMTKALNEMTISCYLPDNAKEIAIGKAEKTCVNTVSKDKSSLLECHIKKVKATSDEELITLMHHEAAGIAGFETNNGSERSDYFITDQLNAYFKKVTVTKLAIRPNAMGCENPIKSKFFRTIENTRTEMCPGERFLNTRARTMDKLYGKVIGTSINDEDKQVVMVSYGDEAKQFELNRRIIKKTNPKQCELIHDIEFCEGETIRLDKRYFRDIPSGDYSSYFYKSHHYYSREVSDAEYLEMKIHSFIPRFYNEEIIINALLLTKNNDIFITDALIKFTGNVPGFENLEFNKETANLFGWMDKVTGLKSYDKQYLTYFSDEDEVHSLYKHNLDFRLNGKLNSHFQNFGSWGTSDGERLSYFDWLFESDDKEKNIAKMEARIQEDLLKACKARYFGHENAVELSEINIQNVEYNSERVFYKYGPKPGQVYYVSSIFPHYDTHAFFKVSAVCNYIK